MHAMDHTTVRAIQVRYVTRDRVSQLHVSRGLRSGHNLTTLNLHDRHLHRTPPQQARYRTPVDLAGKRRPQRRGRVHEDTNTTKR